MNLKKEFERLKYRLDILQEVNCSEDENKEYRQLLKEGKPLPDGVFRRNAWQEIDDSIFYTVQQTELSGDELAEYIQYKQLCTLITIKKCAVFFTVLTVLSIVAGAITILASL